QDIESARAALEAAEAVEKEAATSFERAQALFENGVVAERRLDEAVAGHKTATSQRRDAQEQLEKLLEGTRQEDIDAAKAKLKQAQASLDQLLSGARVEDIAAARAVVQAAQADVARAKKNLAEMTVTAPMAGLVQTLDVEPGDLVGPGPLATLVHPEDLELAVYVSATMLGHLLVGQEVTVTTDSHGDRRFTGRISRIGVSGEFTPRNLQTQEERVQQVFPVDLDLTSNEGMLRPGMAATAHFPVPDAVAAE
ncbi:MAG: HlyD family efflux transporter periplasmic adaptor subunit, partial [Candidatus Hydrogenedentales bacterium]